MGAIRDTLEGHFGTIQKIIYSELIVALLIIVVMFIQMKKKSSIMNILKNKYLKLGLLLFIMCSTLYFFLNLDIYYEKYMVEGIQKVEWQKNRHKVERDMYLTLCSILANLYVLVVSHWVNKYFTFMDLVEEEKAKIE